MFVNDNHEIVIAFRGTSTPVDMIKDAVFDLAAFSPGNRPKSKGPEEVAEEVSDEELEEGGMGGFLKFAEVSWLTRGTSSNADQGSHTKHCIHMRMTHGPRIGSPPCSGGICKFSCKAMPHAVHLH